MVSKARIFQIQIINSNEFQKVKVKLVANKSRWGWNPRPLAVVAVTLPKWVTVVIGFSAFIEPFFLLVHTYSQVFSRNYLLPQTNFTNSIFKQKLIVIDNIIMRFPIFHSEMGRSLSIFLFFHQAVITNSHFGVKINEKIPDEKSLTKILRPFVVYIIMREAKKPQIKSQIMLMENFRSTFFTLPRPRNVKILTKLSIAVLQSNIDLNHHSTQLTLCN